MAQAYDLEEALGTVSFLEGRTPLTDTKGTFARERPLGVRERRPSFQEGDGAESFFQIVCLRHDFLRSIDRG